MNKYIQITLRVFLAFLAFKLFMLGIALVFASGLIFFVSGFILATLGINNASPWWALATLPAGIMTTVIGLKIFFKMELYDPMLSGDGPYARRHRLTGDVTQVNSP